MMPCVQLIPVSCGHEWVIGCPGHNDGFTHVNPVVTLLNSCLHLSHNGLAGVTFNSLIGEVHIPRLCRENVDLVLLFGFLKQQLNPPLCCRVLDPTQLLHLLHRAREPQTCCMELVVYVTYGLTRGAWGTRLWNIWFGEAMMIMDGNGNI